MGREVIEPKFLEVHNFREGLAAVLGEEYLVGYINTKGEYAIEPKYAEDMMSVESANFVNGHAVVSVEDNECFGHFLINKNAEKIFYCQNPENSVVFRGNIAIVSESTGMEKYSILINKKGLYVSKPYDKINTYTKDLYIAEINKKYCILDNTGKELSLFFDKIQKIQTGLSLAFTKEKCVLMKNSGDVISEEFVFDKFLTDKVIRAKQKTSYFSKAALLSTSGEFLSDFYYMLGSYAGDGMVCAKKDDLYGYLNLDGEVVIPFQYKDANTFENGYALVGKETKYYIDSKGKKISPEFDNESSRYRNNFNDIIFKVKKGEKYTCLSNRDKTQLAKWYDDITNFTKDGYAIVTNENKQAVSDTTGKLVTEWYQRVGYFGNNFRVKKNNKFAIFAIGDEKPVFYDYIGAEYENRILVKNNGKCGYLDSLGNFAVELSFVDAGSFKNGFAPVKKNGKWMFINKNGVLQDSHKYDYLDNFYNEMARVGVKKNNKMKYGYIDKDFKLVIPCNYDDSWAFDKKTAYVKENGKWFKIDKKGTLIERKTN